MRYIRLEKVKTKHVQMKLPQQYLLDKISGMFGSLILNFYIPRHHAIDCKRTWRSKTYAVFCRKTDRAG
jgi:hypothetical protein